MSESELAVIKPEALKSYIWLQCFDGSIQQVEEEVAMFCPMICREIVKNGTGSSKNHAITLPERVNPASLSLILDYCRFHQVPGRSNKERKLFDEKFVRIDTERLCELTSAADSLQLKPLVDLTSRALARIIEGKTPEEIRDIFHLPDDLTEEEKLEPLKNINDDPRIRLLNRLYAKKRKELQDRQKLKDVQVQEEQKDERSLDEILCFINGDGGPGCSGCGKAAKNKKKNKRRKDHAKNPPKASPEPVNKEEAVCTVPCNVGSGNISRVPCQSSDDQDDVEYPFEDADLDDGLDPAMQEELDRLSKGMSKADKVVVLERVIGSLGLQEIRNSLVGTVEKRGISGGQRKRVNVGIEMVMEPSLLILDEPTTGLDSASSQLLLRALRHEAFQGVNVCAVIHQPSYILFNMFDDFVLLARGGLIAYHGPISEVEMYFSGLGIKVPERENPPDYYIDILEGIVKTKMRGHVTPKHLPLLWILQNGYEVPEDMRKDLEDINTIHELHTVGSISREQSLAEQSESTDSVHQNVRQSSDLLDRKTPGVLAQYKYYLGRVAKQRLREATQQAADYLILCIAGACIGKIAKVRDDSFGADSYGYTIIAVSLLCQLAALRSFSPERLQYWRERESGMSSLAYFLARDTIDHFNTLVKPIVFLSTFYFFNNPRSTLEDNYLVFLALVYCVTGIGYTFAIWFELGLAQLCSALLPVVMVLAGIQADLPQFIKELCYPKWALEAFIIAGAKKYSGVWLITRCGALLKGKYDINYFGLCIAIIMLYGVLFRFVALLSLLKLK